MPVACAFINGRFGEPVARVDESVQAQQRNAAASMERP
jgi:hypothetical protein